MSSVVVYHRNGPILMGRCGRRINTKVPIDFSNITLNYERTRSPFGNHMVMKDGRVELPITNGNFTVGKDTYAIEPDPVFSGGPSCGTDVDTVNNRVFVHCLGLYWDYTDIVNNTATADTDCFGPFPPTRDDRETDYYTKDEKADYFKKSHLMSKIDRRCKKNSFAKLDGTGWPHPRFLYKQVSDVIQCDKNRECCTGHDKSYTFAFGIMKSIAIGVSAKDIMSVTHTSGYSMTDSWSTGNSYVCHGKPGDRVCVWYKVAHTACSDLSKYYDKNSSLGYLQ
ncbi:hypothetical protein FBULB1_6622 [Fusarium bulbicola]|nr:hypothetical protein FBULB1_6622 [Fusarium bulbicola]